MSVMKPLMRPLIDRRDPHWDKVVSLLHFDGSLFDEGDSTVLSASDHAFATGRYGQGITFTANKGNVLLPYAALDASTTDITIEFFAKPVGYAGGAVNWLLYSISSQVAANNTTTININADGRVVFAVRGSNNLQHFVAAEFNIATNNWYHIAGVKYGNSLLLFIDGVLAGRNDGISPSIASVTGASTIGSHSSSPYNSFVGVIDELRITKGVARYTENFTPPNRPFPNK